MNLNEKLIRDRVGKISKYWLLVGLVFAQCHTDIKQLYIKHIVQMKERIVIRY